MAIFFILINFDDVKQFDQPSRVKWFYDKVIFTLMLFSSKSLSESFQSSNGGYIYCFTQPLTEISSCYSKCVMLFATLANRIFSPANNNGTLLVRWPRKTSKSNNAWQLFYLILVSFLYDSTYGINAFLKVLPWQNESYGKELTV